MPALLPPSMQIGVLPPGYMALPSSGPVRGGTSNPTLPSIVQSAGANTSASGPVNITQTVTSTKVGTYLVWMVAVSASAGAALGGTPTGWTLVASQATATLATGIYVWLGNPGAVTTVTFSSNATATAGGIASWFWEVDNVFFGATKAVIGTGSSTSPASPGVTPANDANLQLGFVSWVLGVATLSGITGGWTTTNAQQSSTAGATNNAAIETVSQNAVFGNPTALSIGGTLSGSSVWIAGVLTIPSTASGQFSNDPVALSGGSFSIDQGAGYAAGGSWGPLGGTKPGGAGGGF